jgi:hypothetical protein
VRVILLFPVEIAHNDIAEGPRAVKWLLSR